MRTISKITLDYAARRGLTIDSSYANDDGINFVLIFGPESDMEPLCQYIEGESGWHFHSNIYLSEEVKVELPAWIKDELHLRQVSNFISIEMTNK